MTKRMNEAGCSNARKDSDIVSHRRCPLRKSILTKLKTQSLYFSLSNNIQVQYFSTQICKVMYNSKIKILNQILRLILLGHITPSFLRLLVINYLSFIVPWRESPMNI